MPNITVNNTSYYYESHGQGQPMVFIAGYASDHLFWEQMLAPLSEQHQVITFDNRAVGQTRDAAQALSLELMAQDTMALIKALGFKKVILVGQSMGGGIAQLIAAQEPDLIERLILLNTAPGISARTLMALKGFIELIKSGASIDAVIEASMPWFFSSTFLQHRPNIDAYKKFVLSNPYPQSLVDLERQFHALTTFVPINGVKQCTVPTLIVSGHDDIICTPVESEQLRTQFPDAKFIIVPSGHSGPLEAPSLVVKAIEAFI